MRRRRRLFRTTATTTIGPLCLALYQEAHTNAPLHCRRRFCFCWPHMRVEPQRLFPLSPTTVQSPKWVHLLDLYPFHGFWTQILPNCFLSLWIHSFIWFGEVLAMLAVLKPLGQSPLVSNEGALTCHLRRASESHEAIGSEVSSYVASPLSARAFWSLKVSVTCKQQCGSRQGSYTSRRFPDPLT